MNKRLFLFWGTLAAVVVAVSAGYLIWDKYLRYDPLKVYQEAERRYVEAMTADTYGGKTPQETLDMFVDALRKEDIELASKYFLLDENLSKEEWLANLTTINSRGLIGDMAQDISTAEFYKSLYDGNQQFVIYNQDRTDSLIINFVFNRYSNIWKIESL